MLLASVPIVLPMPVSFGLLVAVAPAWLVAVLFGEVEVAAGGIPVPWQAAQIPKSVIKENKEIFFMLLRFRSPYAGVSYGWGDIEKLE